MCKLCYHTYAQLANSSQNFVTGSAKMVLQVKHKIYCMYLRPFFSLLGSLLNEIYPRLRTSWLEVAITRIAKFQHTVQHS